MQSLVVKSGVPHWQLLVTLWCDNNLLPRSIGWRLGLQAATGILFTTFILGGKQSQNFTYLVEKEHMPISNYILSGTFYRSATLYHPQV